ncbi:MAG: TPM domain-containing protein, partial [Bacteroidales bacterium]
MKKLLLATLLMFIIQLLPAEVYRIETIPNIQLKDSTQFVSNPDNIISNAAVSTINKELQRVRQV